MRSQGTISRLIANMIVTGLLLGVIAFSCLPYLALIAGSILPNAETDRGIRIGWDASWTLSNHVEFIRTGFMRYSRYAINTFFVSTATSIVVVIISVLGAFGLTRYKLRGRAFFEQLVLWGYAFPPIVLVLPYSVLLKQLNLNGTLWGLILANIAFCFPFGLWLMIRYMEAVPADFDKTAATDGALWWQCLWHIILRRTLPGIAAVAMFSFILSWNDIALSLVLAEDSTRTLADGVKQNILDTEHNASYSTFAAASFWAATPAIIIFGKVQSWIDERLRLELEERQ